MLWRPENYIYQCMVSTQQTLRFYWSIQIQIARTSLLIGCRLTNIYYSSYLVHSRHTRYYFVQVWTQRGGVLSVPVQKSRGKDEYFAQLFMRPDSEIWETECISQGCLGHSWLLPVTTTKGNFPQHSTGVCKGYVTECAGLLECH